MKKILITIFALFLGLQANAATTDATTAQKKLNNIAYVLIKKNALPSGMSIKVLENEEANAYATMEKEIYVYTGMFNTATTDEELAAVMSHEMGHILMGHNAKQSILNTVINTVLSSANADTTAKQTGIAVLETFSSSKLSRKDEFEADLTGVDLLYNAGYNPLAMVSLLNKICGNYIDVISTHPSGEKRLQNIYDYVEYNYPEYAKKGYSTDSYNRAYALIKLNVAERNANPKKLAKWKKEQAKLQQNKIKRAKKMLKQNNAWNSTYNTLIMLNQSTSGEK